MRYCHFKANLNAPNTLSRLYAGASSNPHENSLKKTTDSDTVSTREAGTQTEYDVIYITDLARYFHDIADKLGAGASLYSMQVSWCWHALLKTSEFLQWKVCFLRFIRFPRCVQELSDEKKRLEQELAMSRAKNDEQKKFITAVKSAISHF